MVAAVAHVRLTWVTRLFCHASGVNLSRSPQYGVFICIWRANPKITELRAGETLSGVCGSFYDPDGGLFILGVADSLCTSSCIAT